MKKKIKEVWGEYQEEINGAIEDLKTKGRRYRQIPNILTLTRLVAPCFIIPGAIVGSLKLIVIPTVIFSLTDAADGLIARKCHLTSELGKDLDAICDKVFAGSLLIAASFFNPVLIVNLIFESIIASINIKRKLDNNKPRSLYIGKLKTCALYPLLALGFLHGIVKIPYLFMTLFGITTVLQTLTVGSYLIRYEQADDSVLPKLDDETKIDVAMDEQKDDTKANNKVLTLISDNLKKSKDESLAEYRELRDLISHERYIHEESIEEPQKQKDYKKKN